LAPDQRSDVDRLAGTCAEFDGVDMKLAFEGGEVVTCALAWGAGDIVGYASIDGGSPVEITGMVHPGWRRRGIGRRLLAAIMADVDRRGANVLLIAEEASTSGQAFVGAIGWQPHSREDRMELDRLPGAAPPGGGVDIHVVRRPDADVYAATAARAFDGEGAAAGDRARRSLDIDGEQPFLFTSTATREPIGVARLSPEGGRAAVYGFGVVPAWRRRGAGGRMLDLLLSAAGEGGYSGSVLEVVPDNEPAVRLYRSRGFSTRRTYGYYRPPD
jgi:ribosomal protein S18 acetylase RimI-like enzyme